MSSVSGLVARLLLVAAAYYVGASIGFVLKFPPATPSVMWPPNALLTATLLLTHPRRWWMYLLAALPAHLLVELPVLSPASLVVGLFLTNSLEAILAATLVRAFSDQPTRLDTLRRTAVFVIGAGFVAPFVSSFADAALVTALRGESYWGVWRTRFPSNVLASLTIVPTAVTLGSAGLRRLRAIPLRRLAEAALLASGLLIGSVMAFGGPPGGSAGTVWTPHTAFAWLLPFLLWSAVRFGPGGLSICLLTTTLLAIRAGTLHLGVFTLPDRQDGVLALQIFLTVVGVPLLGLAGVIEERRRTSEALEERLRFEELLSRLSSAFVHLPSREMDRAIDSWLERLGDYLRVDGVVLVEFGRHGEPAPRSWTTSRSTPARPTALGDLPGTVTRLRDRLPVVFSDLGELSGPASGGLAAFREIGVRSGVVLPLEAGNRVIGAIAVVTLHERRAWGDGLEGRLRLVGLVFANALARRESEDALRESEGMKSAILASLSSGVVVLDRAGTVIAVNEGWTKHVAEAGATAISATGVGGNYLTAWRVAANGGLAHAREAVAGIEGILERRRGVFSLEYASASGPTERGFLISAVPLGRPEGGAVISHTEITDWKRAELDAQRSRQELAHFTRVSTMGALAASLAHELNQPLTGILSNAQAARRFLETTPPDLGEIRDILVDIVEDDKRAGEVIERLRDLLRKGDLKAVPLDLNAMVRDVVKLLGSDAVIRNVRIQLVLHHAKPTVAGDRIQLQQVLLNLLVNAMDAMVDCPDDDRVLVVETDLTRDGIARVAVRDAGTGLDPRNHAMIFEPFFTTKPAGMGMGLSISRSIVEAHGGQIWATNNPDRGTTFSFTLPLDPGNPA